MCAPYYNITLMAVRRTRAGARSFFTIPITFGVRLCYVIEECIYMPGVTLSGEWDIITMSCGFDW